ncbi:Lymphocyte cytosolic protein 2 [Liparis tanakae]|uniref:Lymphocyte cytosolic protein 2 n=1 Tax=Liparis tanakae TaxID=230148 RepID=A0A4Z2FXG5_9TELE|nr:Lymphocyte cytosolic protein 2 [Liparis tanakae]
MSSEWLPSRAEVMGWSPQQLADYLKRMNLSGCDKVVLKNSISGSRFVNLSDNDLQKFPKLHAPMVSKSSADINRREERKGLFGKKSTPKYNEPAPTDAPPDLHGWAEDEFDDEEFDNDYESPFSGDEGEGSGGDYESPNEDPDGANDYEPPPTEPPADLVPKPSSAHPDSDYIGPQRHAAHTPGPRPHRSQLDSPDPPTWSKPPVLPLASVSRSSSSARPPPNRSDVRSEDGAFVVRDSSQQQPLQPFTLMVLYQQKVFNIQVRQQQQRFLLGTGLKVQELFSSVSGIIAHYSQNPLLLIDAKNRASGQQNQCQLAEPAGDQMSRQQRS